MTDSGNFDWHAAESRQHIIVRRAEPLAVYPNADGDVVIRKMQEWPDEDCDTIVIVPGDRAWDFAHAVLCAAGLTEEPTESAQTGARLHARASAASRQQRYRDRQRHARNVSRDNQRLADGVTRNASRDG